MKAAGNNQAVVPTQEEIDNESRRIRRLRILVQLTLETIAGGASQQKKHQEWWRQRGASRSKCSRARSSFSTLSTGPNSSA